MITVLYYIAAVSFLLWVVRNTFFWVSLWQRREYRYDRLFAELSETHSGKSILFSFYAIFKWILILGFAFAVYNPLFLVLYQIVVTLVLLIEGVAVIHELLTHTFRRPKFTTKALLLIGIVIYIYTTLFLIPLTTDPFVWLMILDILLPFVVGCVVFAVSLPTVLYKDYQIERATKKILKSEKLLVIGVTGSYGKSSTKEFIAQVLSHKFEVLKTKYSDNTPIGVAYTILKGLKNNTQIFVAEMGAYKKGEIAELCAIARPKIGVLTAIAGQHLSLFGSIENIEKTKYELIESLPRNGLALFNGNNERVFQLYKNTTKKKVLYRRVISSAKKTVLTNVGKLGDIVAYNISGQEDGTHFDVQLRKKILHLKTSLIGLHMVENILPAIYLADYLGMSDMEIKTAVSKLTPLPHTMVRSELSNGSHILDNTFNANPDSVIATLEYIKQYKGKRIFILEPMIELGKKGKEEHYRVAKAISVICDYLFLVNKNFYKEITQGITDGKGECKVKTGTIEEITDFVVNNTKKGDISVMMGKGIPRVIVTKVRKA